MFQGQFDPSHQIHDFNPGIAPNGLFWTMPVPPESVSADLTRGTASLRVRRTSMLDQQNLINALLLGPGLPAVVSFDVRWGGGMMKKKALRNAQQRFVAEIVETASTIEWEATVGGHRLRSDAAGMSKSLYALIGRERNGRFF